VAANGASIDYARRHPLPLYRRAEPDLRRIRQPRRVSGRRMFSRL